MQLRREFIKLTGVVAGGLAVTDLSPSLSFIIKDSFVSNRPPITEHKFCKL